MQYASGEYIAFLDSDDYYVPEALERAYNKAKEDCADVCVFGAINFCEGTLEELAYEVLPFKKMLPKTTPFNISDIEKRILNFSYNVVWNKMFKRRFLEENNILFPPIRRGEDLCFSHWSLCLAKRITVLYECLVNYRLFRQDSLSSTNGENPGDIMDSYLLSANKLKELGVYPEQSFLNNILGNIALVLKTIRVSWPVFEAVFLRLKNTDLEKLGLIPREPGYYYSSWDEKMLQLIYQNEKAEEFLLAFLFLMEMRYKELRTKKILQEQRNKEEQKKMMDQNKKLKEDIRKIRLSKSYQIGRLLTWIPRKIK